ncbi:hypothetical protein AGMMS49992_13550 [Clostridia bacterium]|nr:hypothetical protein AGMMS49992_13550 [Clostridia bacterium]
MSKKFAHRLLALSLLLIVLFTVAGCLDTGNSSASDQDLLKFLFKNEYFRSTTVTELYVKPHSSDSWGTNLLYSPLKYGDYIQQNFALDQQKDLYWDIKVVAYNSNTDSREKITERIAENIYLPGIQWIEFCPTGSLAEYNSFRMYSELPKGYKFK